MQTNIVDHIGRTLALFLGVLGVAILVATCTVKNDVPPKGMFTPMGTITNQAMANETYYIDGPSGSASAVYLEANVLLTAKHVCDDLGSPMHIADAKGNLYLVKQTVTSDDDSVDLCLVYMGDDFRALTLPARLPIGIVHSQLGDSVIAGGYPLRVFKLTYGHVISESLYPDLGTALLYEIDNYFDPGNSGGPVFNRQNELVGIVDAYFRHDARQVDGLFVPVMVIKHFLKEHAVNIQGVN